MEVDADNVDNHANDIGPDDDNAIDVDADDDADNDDNQDASSPDWACFLILENFDR